jgi:hypothetical protein
MPRLARALAVLALALVSSTARADHRRVALVNANDALERQVRIALSAWELDVRRVEWQSMSAAMPNAAHEARQIADAVSVDAVVWISATSTGYALWIYDAGDDQVVTRPLAQGEPATTEDAASVALTVKTLMRSSTVAPPNERIGAVPEAKGGPLGLFRAEADAGGRALASDAAGAELRFGLGAVWWPRLLGQRAGLAFAANAGPRAAIKKDLFTGRFLDIVFSPSLRAHFALGGRFALEPGLGVSVHLMMLDGAAQARVDPVREVRVDPSLDGSFLVSYALGRSVDVGLRAMGAYLVRYQVYKVLGMQVLELSPGQIGAAFVLGARLN